MKILKHGKKPEEPAKLHGECDVCECWFECDLSEVRKVGVPPGRTYYHPCPECGYDVVFMQERPGTEDDQ